MALIAWLLNGDLNNYGIGAVTVTNHGATLDNTCKTGKGYNFASNTYIDATIPSITGNFTVAWWEYSTNFNNGTMPWGIQMFNPFYSKCLNTGDGVDNPWYKPGTTTAINDLSNSVWHHFAVTGNGNVNYLYIDGSLYGQSKIYKKLNSTTLRFNGWPYDTNYKRNGKLCDWRLYNTCLSADQIKEISRGMVLHYKMCGNVQAPNNCYAYPTFDISATDGGWGHWTASGGSGSFAQNTDKNFIFRSGQTYSHKVTCDSSATWDYLCYQEPEFSGGYRSMCAIIKASDSTRITENICYPSWNAQNGGVENKKWTSVNKLRDGFYLCKCEGIKQDGSNDLVGIYVKPGKTIYISECYLENDYERCSDFWTRTDIEYDGSGYKNHSSHPSNSMPVFVSDSPRYTGSYKFIGNNSQLNIPITKMSGYTICFWRKGTATERWLPLSNNGSNKWLGAAEVSGSYSTIYHSGCSCGICYVDGVAATVYPRDNNWHFYCYTNVTLDWDGVWIHGYNGYRPTDYWSDFRIYATVLDATDVAELYKLGK